MLRRFRIPVLSGCLVLLVHPSAQAGDVTEWDGTVGAWSEAASWSDGVPSAAHTAIVGSGTTQIITTDAVCENLVLAQGASGTVWLSSGSLTVGTEILIGEDGTGSLTHVSGTVTAPTVRIRRGGFTVGPGTVEVTDCFVGESGSLAFLSMGGGNLTIANTCVVVLGGSMTLGGGTCTVGTDPEDALVVRGGLGVTNPGRTTILQNLTMEGASAFFHPLIGSNGFAKMTVNGTFTRDGQFRVIDAGTFVGRYDILTAGAIDGEFATIDLPDGWSWGIEGTTLWVEKGTSPVATTSWGGIKHEFER
jgi:hypothetical protein